MSAVSLPYQKPVIVQRDWKPFCWLLTIMLLLSLQLASGTQPLFALLVTLFCLLTYLSVRGAGGLTSLTGVTITYLAAQNVLISQVAKIYFWEPADSRLLQPIITMGVYDCAMLGTWLAVALFRRTSISRRRPLFPPEVDPARLMWIAYITTAMYVFQAAFVRTAGVNTETGAQNIGGIYGFIQQVPFLGPLSLASGTAYIIIASRGRRSIGLINLISLAIPIVAGLLGASREALISFFILYFLICIALRFRFRPIHFVVVPALACLAQFIFFPYALYARNFVRGPNVEKNIEKASSIFLDVISDPVKYQVMETMEKKRDISLNFLYYGRPIPTLDRFSQISEAAGLVDATVRQGTTGMDSITPGFLAVPPRFLLPEKPVGSVSNDLAHREPGMIGKNDHGTGITMGFAVDSFGSFGWPGALIIPFLLTFVLLCIFNLIISVRLQNNIYALCLMVWMPHVFSESPIAGQISLILQLPVVFTIVIYLILFAVSFAMRTQVRIQEAKHRSARVGRARLANRGSA